MNSVGASKLGLPIRGTVVAITGKKCVILIGAVADPIAAAVAAIVTIVAGQTLIARRMPYFSLVGDRSRLPIIRILKYACMIAVRP